MKRTYTEKQKKEFAANAKAKADAAQELLKKGIQDMFSSENYSEFLKFYSGFHQYSFGNTVLIMMQMPTASRCASYIDWKKRGRQVKKGEHGLMVMVPTPKKWKTVNEQTGEEEEHSKMYYKVGSVFDISQTEGNEIPEISHKLTGDVNQFNKVFNAIKSAVDIPVTVEDFDNTANGYYSTAENKIVIKSGLSQMQTIKTLCHEGAHSILHCKGGEMEKADRNTMELQAESVAFIVCNYLGIDSSDYSFGYVAGWSKDKSSKQLEKNMAVISKTAMQMISKIEEGKQ